MQGQEEMNVSIQQSMDSPSSAFLLIRPSVDWMMLGHVGDGEPFTQSMDSNLIFSRHTLTETSKKKSFPSYLDIPYPS